MGWQNGAWGLHGDDGCVYSDNRASGFPLFGAGDTMGIGYIGHNQTLFFTKNGKIITGGREIKCDNSKYSDALLHPCVSFYAKSQHGDVTITANFGLDAFQFEGDDTHAVIRANCIVQERERREGVMTTVRQNLEQRTYTVYCLALLLSSSSL